MSRFYLLGEDHAVTPTDDVVAWARGFEDFDAHRVAHDTLSDGTTISTTFLGLNRALSDETPLIFETMLFDPGATDMTVWRYSTWSEALAGHLAALAFARNCEAWAAEH